MKKKCTNPECEQPMKDVSEFHVRSDAKDGLSHHCRHCHSKAGKLYRLNNKEAISKVKWEYCQSNKGRKAAYDKQYRVDNKDMKAAYSKSYYEANRSEIAEYKKIYREKNREVLIAEQRKYYQNSPETYMANTAKRRAALLQRTVSWANLKKITELYWVAKTLTERTGIKWVVDHKVPLQGKNVSGFHVENNLQVITHSRNATKHNKFIPIWGMA